ncbi:MAG: ATP-binding protein [Candidatus Zixiibacteriota bacterium]
MDTNRIVRVLLIDDDEDEFIITNDTLDSIKEIKYNVTWAPNTEDAIETLKDRQYDIILLDYYLGAETGLDALVQIRKCDKKTPVIVLTGLSDIKIDIEFMHAGAVDYIVKDDLSGPLLERTIRYAIERNNINMALSTLVKRHSTIINAVPVAIYLKNYKNEYIEVNDYFCELIGKSKEDIIGKSIYEICDGIMAKQLDELDKEAFYFDEPKQNYEIKLDVNNNESMRVSITRIPLTSSGEKTENIVGLIQDITQMHNSRQQLIQSEKLAAIGQLAAGVAHEINNPVGYIKSNLGIMSRYLDKLHQVFEIEAPQILESQQEIIDDFREAINESIDGTTRIINIVSDLKNFARLDKAEMDVADLNQGIISTLNIVNNELKYKCEVFKELGDIPQLYCRLNQLNQVFLILLINAGQAITENGKIHISTMADEQNIYIKIRDNGSGIPEPILNRIFEPFFTTKEVGKGTGLGLSLAYDIIVKHNGIINVNSEIGVGTEFTITLPIKTKPSPNENKDVIRQRVNEHMQSLS